jgi:hypothetical protein
MNLKTEKVADNAPKQEIQQIERVPWHIFKDRFFGILYTFIPHHIEYIWNFRCRRDFNDLQEENMPNGCVSGHFDYINNIPVRNQIKTTGAWSHKIAVAEGVGILRYRKQSHNLKRPFFRDLEEKKEDPTESEEDLVNENEEEKMVIEEDEEMDDCCDPNEGINIEFDYGPEYKGMNDLKSFKFFKRLKKTAKLDEAVIILLSKDPKHTWSSALRMIDEILIRTKKEHDLAGVPFEKFYGYSDGCTGEFANSSFIRGLQMIRGSHGLKEITWTFTTAHHGKSKCDGEGHISKVIIRNGVSNLEVVYSFTEPFEVTMISYLRKKYDEYDSNRILINMSSKPASHMKSRLWTDTWTGFQSFSSYRMTEYGITRRYLDCKCDVCLNFDEDEWEIRCPNEAVVGEWDPYWEIVNAKKYKGEDGNREWETDECLYNYLTVKQTPEWIENHNRDLRQQERDLQDEMSI